ncbi:molybdopterin-dependent oxidoreductase [Actinoplanes teichomyceticus]|uniref:DMSO/TMAO reductase YedYZ molybdopterin-dependent catalytic subunit n=1 Tax=Actinoplanes teichomyceticus TaxID=1867 RepID=A0A561VCL1_ACTTI|nr:molybdopterin-dependent oxidoreductase [Actinoplanes teichomyceticus]TWG09349.1 DMSO/TMAO reductase YedYZ molybdopterin-dependent catalytic subunit [Actinoplanes teichomyceticus]GIF16627.1 molybdopterin-binding protein [Actinoplanes teichomyceticus]
MVRHPGRRLTRALAWLAHPPVRPESFPSPLRSTRLTSRLGLALGVAFAVCFVTGLLSHLIQQPPGWFRWPSHPAGLYRFTQGLHVATGLATVPLLGAKLWSVYPRLFTRPVLRDLAHAAERLSVAVLVGAALFQVVSGLLNISHWYAPMPFFFTAGHYWVAWLSVGALLTHIGVQLPAIRAALPRGGDDPQRRRFLATVAAAAGVITVATAGQTVRPLAAVSVLAPRRPGTGPQGVPVNRTAAAAGVRDAALHPGYRLTVAGFGRTVELGLADLAGLPQHTTVLPIACVEGWSCTATWTGVRLADLARLLGVDPAGCVAVVRSLQTAGRYRSSTVAGPHLVDGRTLVALRLGGEPLALDHGYPARLIAPNRPGVLQTKWLSRISLRAA